MTYCVSDMNNTVSLLMKTLNADKQNQITLAAQYHNAALFHFKAYPGTLSLSLCWHSQSIDSSISAAPLLSHGH